MTLELSPTQAVLCRLLAGGVPPVADGPALVDLALANGVAPLLHHRLQQATVPLDEAGRQRLALAYMASGARNRQLRQALGALGPLLAEHGQEAVLLKGASLIARLYEDPALRPMNDLDLWVPGPGAFALWQRLVQRGLAVPAVPAAPALSLVEGEVSARMDPARCQRDLGHLSPLWLPAYRLKLDLLPRLDWERSLLSERREQAIWANRQPWPEVPGLALVAPADEPVILLAHLLRHAMSGGFYLLRAVDLVVAWQRPAWRQGFLAIRHRPAVGALALALAALAPGQEQLLAAPPWPARRLFHAAGRGVVPQLADRGWLERRLALLDNVPDGAGRFRYAWSLVFPAPAYMRQQYALRRSLWLPLCYAHRLASRTIMAISSLLAR
ncbi:MAG: nucleotidyltransferase family protein [Thermodesulfobacteriota bacterium]